MAAWFPLPVFALAGVLHLAEGGPSLVTEGSALVMALAIILYLVRQEQHAKRASKNGRGLYPCIDHATSLAVLKRDLKHLNEKLARLCDAQLEARK